MEHGGVTEGTIGCFYRVYRELGYGHSEQVASSALMLELAEAGFACAREVAIEVRYHGRPVGQLRIDAVVDDRVVLELKAGPRLDPFAMRQLYNYLRCSGYRVGLLLYFGPEPLVRRLDYRPGQPSRPRRAGE